MWLFGINEWFSQVSGAPIFGKITEVGNNIVDSIKNKVVGTQTLEDIKFNAENALESTQKCIDQILNEINIRVSEQSRALGEIKTAAQNAVQKTQNEIAQLMRLKMKQTLQWKCTKWNKRYYAEG